MRRIPAQRGLSRRRATPMDDSFQLRICESRWWCSWWRTSRIGVGDYDVALYGSGRFGVPFI